MSEIVTVWLGGVGVFKCAAKDNGQDSADALARAIVGKSGKDKWVRLKTVSGEIVVLQTHHIAAISAVAAAARDPLPDRLT